MRDLHSLGVRVKEGKLLVLDQTLLPHDERWVECQHPKIMFDLIQRLAVRGAPLIGVAAALAIGQFAEIDGNLDNVKNWARNLRRARPTAVNLMIAMDRLLKLERVESIPLESEKIFLEDVSLCDAMANRGVSLIQDGDGILTHCNTGGLATAGIGTALGVIRRAHEQGKKIHVFVDETRPLLQGARLTAWELSKLEIPHTLICDNMAAFLMAQGKVNRIFVGADRIAANGDFANKIGTYGLAVAARYHEVPFYVVAPQTTLDPLCPSGSDIPIEQRPANEVLGVNGPKLCTVWNPAFDVTPRELITGIVLDHQMM